MSQPSEALLAIDFGGTKVAVTTGTGNHLVAHEFAAGATPAEVLQLAVDLAASLGAEPELVSIATPGVIVDGHALFAPNVDGWDQVDLGDWARRTFGAEVLVSNDVEAAAAGEALSGALRGVDVGLYLNIGTGIAAAIVVAGTVLKGAHQLGGEIGYAKVGPTPAIRWSSDVAPLEGLSGGVGFRQAGIRLPDDVGLDWLDAPEGTRAREALDELARHLVTCVLLVDPSVIVVGGGLARVPVVMEHLRRRVGQAALAPVDLVVSAFGPHASVLGALAIGNSARTMT